MKEKNSFYELSYYLKAILESVNQKKTNANLEEASPGTKNQMEMSKDDSSPMDMMLMYKKRKTEKNGDDGSGFNIKIFEGGLGGLENGAKRNVKPDLHVTVPRHQTLFEN